MIKTAALTFFAIFFALLNCTAQNLYRKGFIITANNETVHGLINDKETAQSPESIEFKENDNAEVRTYTWKDIRAFATSRGVYYESQHFQYDADVPASEENHLLPRGYHTSRSPEKWTTTDCFLEVITKGKFSLYMFHDANDRVHFFILDEGKTELEELLYRPFMTQGSAVLSANESYKQQLVIRAEPKCANLKSQITHLAYRRKNMARLVTSINECYGAVQKIPAVAPDAIARKRAQFGIVAEAYVTNPMFIVTTGGYNPVQFGGGISYELFSKKRPNRLSFYSELKFKNYSKHDTYRSKFSFTSATGTLSHHTLKLTNMVRIYPVNLKNLFVDIGAVYGRRFNTRLSGTIITDRDAADRFEFGYAAGVGKKFNSVKLSIETRFEFNTPSAQKSFGLLLQKYF